MRILVLNQFFWPDSSATSQLLTDVARELASRGHEVHAICGTSGYATAGIEDIPPVIVHRVTSLPFARGVLARVLSYASFYIGAAWRGLTIQRPDVVLTLTTPPLLSVLGSLIQRVRGSEHFIWEMDLYPEIAVELGQFKPGGIAERITGLLADHARARANGVIALGECMKDKLLARGHSADRVHVVDNWADSAAIHPIPWPVQQNQLTVLYSGNLGAAHDVGTITDAMLLLHDDPRFHFTFVGAGSGRHDLALLAREKHLHNLELRPYATRANLSESLGACDIGLVTQRDVCCGSVVPSKIYGLLAAGRPILYIGPSASTPARIIKRFGCGWAFACGDASEVTDVLRHLHAHPEEIRLAGARARKALLTHFDRPIGVARIADILGTLPVETTVNNKYATALSAHAFDAASPCEEKTECISI